MKNDSIIKIAWGSVMLAVSGLAQERITLSDGETVSITNVTFLSKSADYGGAVSNESGVFYMTGGGFINNSAKNLGGAVYSTGTNALVDLTNVFFSNNTATYRGGAIFNATSSSLNLSDSIFFGNTARLGGAIGNRGEVTILSSTFDSNSAENNAGAILQTATGTLTLLDTIFRGNSAAISGGAIGNLRRVNIISNHFENNSANSGGAIHNNSLHGNAHINVTNTFFLENKSAVHGGAIFNNGIFGLIDSRFENNTAQTNGGAIFNVRVLYTNEMILTEGEIALTNVFFSGNSASGAGGAVANWYIAKMTGGAFSNNVAGGNGGAFVNDSWSNAVNGLVNSGDASFENVRFENNTANNGGAIENRSILNISGEGFINNSAENFGGAVNNYNADSYAFLTDVFFADNVTSNRGGAIYNIGNLVIESGTFSGNSAQTNGGAIFNHGTFVIKSSGFTNNHAVNSGGAILNNMTDSTNTLENSFFVENTANAGGAIWNARALDITEALFSKNSARFRGGAVFNSNSNGVLTLADVQFLGNTATNSGGAVFNNQDATAIATNTIFNGNEVSRGDGGAIYNIGKFYITDSSLMNNTVSNYGGAVYNTGTNAVIEIANSDFTANSALWGGAIFNTNNGIITATNTIFSGNSSKGSGGAIRNYGLFAMTNGCFTNNLTIGRNYGGAIYNVGTNATINLTNVSFYNNTGAYVGGAIYSDKGNLTASGGEFVNNHADFGGAVMNACGLFVHEGTANFSKMLFLANSATTNGGAIYNSGVLNISECTFVSNSAYSGGAIYGLPQSSSSEACIINLQDVSFYDNIATNSGGAIFGTGNGVFTFVVSENKTAVFSGNRDKNGANSVFLNSGSITVDTAHGGILDMRDPMRAANSAVSVTKTGGGRWKLGGTNHLSSATVSLNAGTLELYSSAVLNVSNFSGQAGAVVTFNYPSRIQIVDEFSGNATVVLTGYSPAETNLLISAKSEAVAETIAASLHFLSPEFGAIAIEQNVYAVPFASAFTQQSPEPVPYAWLELYGLVAPGSSAEEYENAAMDDVDHDGYTAWQEYIAGTDPTDENSVFRAVMDMMNGEPEITWNPDLTPLRHYFVEGRETLSGGTWTKTNNASQYFRVKVEMP
ncbi:MAG: hypothetical protein WC959_04610 [Kiritimatiellales bacterium]